MSDKLLPLRPISAQIEFDQHGRYTLTEVVDLDALETIGGGWGLNIYCPREIINQGCVTNNCPGGPPPTPPQPLPTPAPPTPPKPEEGKDGDEE